MVFSGIFRDLALLKCMQLKKTQAFHKSEAKYDCGAGFENWRADWSEDKTTWCCESLGSVGDGCKMNRVGSGI